jgi:hypothetical protein
VNSCAMVHACLVHQCPELLDPAREALPEGVVPHQLRYGGGTEPVSTAPVIPEEPSGNPEADRW